MNAGNRTEPIVWISLLSALLFTSSLIGQTPESNDAGDNAGVNTVTSQEPPVPAYKELPPAGIEIPDETREQLEKRLGEIQGKLDQAVTTSADASVWQSDVAVLLRAVRLALKQDIFFKVKQTDDASKLLDEAERRLKAAEAGDRGLKLMGFNPSQIDQPQPLVGGFVSRIDDSVQPYGIVVPAGFQLSTGDDAELVRLDVWLHGRGDTKTEIPFLRERMTKNGQYTPADTLVLHPFGRHCNAFKFAGETDVYEAMQHSQTFLPIDPQRIAIRGFSMGGAGCWHLGVHDPGQWFAVNPGAGFVDTIEYQGWSDSTPFPLTPTAEKLMRWYDVLPWVQNLTGTNVVAYSGEVDKQKTAADRVVARASQLGMELPYVVGAGMGHKIDPPSANRINERIAEWAKLPIKRPVREINFVTYTLRYSGMDWIRITGMQEHWALSGIKATLDETASKITVVTNGVTNLEIDFSDSGWPQRRGNVAVDIDGQAYEVEDSGNERGFQCQLAKDSEGSWTARLRDEEELRKRPGLQGPIDDAFCDRFVIVLPSRPARHGRVQRWVDREIRYLRERWSRLMRGDVQVVLDRDVTEDQLETCHLICFGDFSSNRFLFNISGSLPINWTRETLTVGGKTYDPAKHTPVFCYPNPLNPKRYVVVNSGMTFREFSNVSNSRQIAMLPDWAVLDVTAEDDSIYAGKIVDQGFFNEAWQMPGAVEVSTE